MAPIFGLASETGAVVEIYKRLLRDKVDEDQVRELLKQELGDILWFCATIAASHGLDLEDIAQLNLNRARGRYGPMDGKAMPDFENGFGPEQRFPRRVVIRFQERKTKGRPHAYLTLIDAEPNGFPKGSRKGKNAKKVGYDIGKPLGDTLTDHQRRADAYRFHDALHMAFMAVLGWSPAMRYLLRVKRKADPDTEEGEDSARQWFAEEGLAAVLAQMAKKRLGFLHERSVNEEVLDIVHAVTNDVEVRAVPDRLWARAISQGFQVMKQLADHGGGYVIANLDKRTLEFAEEWP